MKIDCYIGKDEKPKYDLSYMSEEELRSLLIMINGAGLVERRHWNGIKTKIQTILSNQNMH